MYLENSKVKDFVKSEIIYKLVDFKNYDEPVCACDLAYIIFESDNINGAYFCNDWTAKNWIKEHFDDLSEIIEEIQSQFDKDFCDKIMIDFFNNPDSFIVVVVLEVASYLLGQCKYIDENWDDKIILTNDIIDIICLQIDEL